MSRIAYVNGRFLSHCQAGVSIDDRGYQFADGVYEVIEVRGSFLVDEDLHLDRLDRSLFEIKLPAPLSRSSLRLIVREVVRRNRVRDGMVYLQVSRGVAARDHFFPDPPVKPSLVITARSIDADMMTAKAARGIRVITLPDIRWKRPDIKSISLLPNVLAKQEAKSRGAAEAWLYGEDGLIREGAASNAWIITDDRRVLTHPVDRTILEGVTRTTLLAIFPEFGLTLEQRPFSRREALEASAAFVTGATTLIMPVVAIDDRPIGGGTPGELVGMLRRRFVEAARRT